MSRIIPLDSDAWLHDPDLRFCTPYDRGVLIDLMCIATRGQPYGHVTNGGTAVSDEKIARFLHITTDDFISSKNRLHDNNRIGIAEHTGAIFIPRMVRDGAVREAATEGGKRGGNPALGGDTPKVKKAKPITAAIYYNALPDHLKTDAVREAVGEWLEYRTRRRIVLTEHAVQRQVASLSTLSPEQAVQWIHCAIDKNWQAFYPPRENGKFTKHNKGDEYGTDIGGVRIS